MGNGEPNVGPVGQATKYAVDGGTGDAEQDGGIQFTRHEDEGQHDSQAGGLRFRQREIADADEGGGIGNDQFCVAQSDEGNEHTNAGSGGVLQAVRDAVDDLLAHASDSEQHKQNSREEDRAQGSLPGNSHAPAYRVGEVCVERHPRGHSDGIICV